MAGRYPSGARRYPRSWIAVGTGESSNRARKWVSLARNAASVLLSAVMSENSATYWRTRPCASRTALMVFISA